MSTRLPDRLWHRLDAVELPLVRCLVRLGHRPSVRVASHLVNVSADGWIYLPLALGMGLLAGPRALDMILHTGLAVLLAQLMHMLLKRLLRRVRPVDRDPSLRGPTRTLDRYSFPSGHCMTLACVSVSFLHLLPGLLPAVATGLLVLALCRLIAAHHYPSDVLAGIALGLAVGWAMGPMAP